MRILVALGGWLLACNYEPKFAGPTGPPGADAEVDSPVTDGATDTAIDAPLAPCPAAPGGCTLFECAGSTSCYYACSTKRTWNASRDRCVADQRGCLVTIDDAAENSCVFANTAPIAFPDLVWFGFKQAQDQGSPGAGWSWQCETSSFLAGNWGQFEPNDNSNPPNEDNRENCGAMGDGGAWIDGGSGTPMRYVCELPR